ncbi:MAG TPA: AzlC family ABC transporter permease [Erysipelotrichaceae bacterium]|nr:AzlC family ABC transporter permease [Erysipelotrichaceae bacterium]
MKLKALKSAFPITLPVFTGYLFLGIGYGILMNKSGLSLPLTFIMSSLVFTGAMQFASIPLFLSSFNPISLFLLAMMVNLRHLFYGISLLPKYKNLGLKKFFMIFALSDETFSINVATRVKEDINPAWFYFFVTLLDYLYWNIASIIGFLLASQIPNNIKGIDFVLTALFYVLFLNQWEVKQNRTYLLLGLFCTTLALVLVGKTQFLLLSMVLLFGCLFVDYKRSKQV